jgi:hypothetical protein
MAHLPPPACMPSSAPSSGCSAVRRIAAAASAPSTTREVRASEHTAGRGSAPRSGAPASYCDATVANREIRVWHFVIENGY